MAKTFNRTLLSLFLIVSIVVICFGQKKTVSKKSNFKGRAKSLTTAKKSDWERNNLRGRVKSLTTTEYYATEKFGEPVKTTKKEKEIDILEFDSKGMILHPKSGANTVFKYDASGNVIEEIRYNSEGEQIKKIVNIYDEIGNLIVNKEYDKTLGNTMVSKYKYDNYGRPIRFTWGIGDGVLVTESCKFNVKGDVIERSAMSWDGNSKKKTYKYIYDEIGNWITKVTYSCSSEMNTKAEAFTERVIEYFKSPAQIEMEYKGLITKADSSFASKNYSEAIDYYQKSLEIKNDTLIKRYIANAQTLKIEDNYLKQISVADVAFNEKKYTIAVTEYQKALEIKDVQYPKDKLKEAREIINEEKLRKDKFDESLKNGNIFFESKKFKEALVEYKAANSIMVSNDITTKIEKAQKEIYRIDSLQKVRLEIYQYLITRNETIGTEMTNLKTSLDKKKKVFGKNYELCMNYLNSNFPLYFSNLNAMFLSNKTTGLKVEESWNEIDQNALDILTKFKEDFKQYEKFHNSIKTAFEEENKDQLKLLKSSDDPKEIISKF
jgi:tetratricopeptide (TPR) repeat protein